MSPFWNSQFCRIYNLLSKKASTDIAYIAPHITTGIFSKKLYLPLLEEIWGLLLSVLLFKMLNLFRLIFIKTYLKSCRCANNCWTSLQNSTDRVCSTVSLTCYLFLVGWKENPIYRAWAADIMHSRDIITSELSKSNGKGDLHLMK